MYKKSKPLSCLAANVANPGPELLVPMHQTRNLSVQSPI